MEEKIYSNFIEFYEAEIAHRNTLRIDGDKIIGNRKTGGIFKYNGQIWQVNQDSYIEPLKKAYNTFIDNQDPFTEKNTRNNKGRCLELNSSYFGEQKSKNMYIYRVK
jgi:hypothetical protein